MIKLVKIKLIVGCSLFCCAFVGNVFADNSNYLGIAVSTDAITARPFSKIGKGSGYSLISNSEDSSRNISQDLSLYLNAPQNFNKPVYIAGLTKSNVSDPVSTFYGSIFFFRYINKVGYSTDHPFYVAIGGKNKDGSAFVDDDWDYKIDNKNVTMLTGSFRPVNNEMFFNYRYNPVVNSLGDEPYDKTIDRQTYAFVLDTSYYQGNPNPYPNDVAFFGVNIGGDVFDSYEYDAKSKEWKQHVFASYDYLKKDKTNSLQVQLSSNLEASRLFSTDPNPEKSFYGLKINVEILYSSGKSYHFIANKLGGICHLTNRLLLTCNIPYADVESYGEPQKIRFSFDRDSIQTSLNTDYVQGYLGNDLLIYQKRYFSRLGLEANQIPGGLTTFSVPNQQDLASVEPWYPIYYQGN